MQIAASAPGKFVLSIAAPSYRSKDTTAITTSSRHPDFPA
jgi:hypothetical protein